VTDQDSSRPLTALLLQQASWQPHSGSAEKAKKRTEQTLILNAHSL